MGGAPGYRHTAPQASFRIKLFDPETKAMHGPFEMRDGAMIRIGDRFYEVKVEELARTQQQIELEDKLRGTTLPHLSLEDAPLAEVADLLARSGGVNIVVVPDYQPEAPTITIDLRNIPLYDAIRYVTEVTDLTFRIDDHAVVIRKSIDSRVEDRAPSR